MKFLHLNKSKSGKVAAQVREKPFKYGDVTGIESISTKKRCILIAGKLSSGKTRYLQKMYEHAEGIYRAQLKPYAHTNNQAALAVRDDRPAFKMSHAEIGWSFPTPVLIHANATQAEWIDLPHVSEWWDQQAENKDMPYKKLKTHDKRKAIVGYLKATRAVLFIDDLDKVPLKKIQFFKELLGVASRTVITAATLNQIPQGLRMMITKQDDQLQHIELTTDASFDATQYIMFIVIMISMLSGQWAVAAFTSAVYGLGSKGNFKTKF